MEVIPSTSAKYAVFDSPTLSLVMARGETEGYSLMTIRIFAHPD